MQRYNSIALSSGMKIPMVGLGVYKSEPGAETYQAVLQALQLGYRHVDTAQFYKNEDDVGRAINDSGINRSEIFVTSKVTPFAMSSGAKTLASVKASLDKLNIGYIDLMLLHAPGEPSSRAGAWAALEEAQSLGIVRDIGVSNFGQGHLEKLMTTAKVKPCVNQIELHPWLQRRELVNYCNSQGIHLQAYSPLAKASKLDEPLLKNIASKKSATPAQVLIAWSLSKGFITLPKSVNAERQKQNLHAAELVLSSEDIEALDSLECNFITGWDPITQHPV